MNSKRKVFVIMPFEDEFFEMYEMLKMEFAQDYNFTNAGDEGNQQNILRDIIEPIYRADIVIADLTGLNPNVMYELGVAHPFNKKTIVITKDDLSALPFDLKQYRAKDYLVHLKKFAELFEYLKLNMEGAINGTVSYSNPVKDFMALAGIENTNSLAKDIQKMTEEEMETMTQGVSESSAKIERVNKTGGKGVASFARKETKKVAKYVEEFASKLCVHNKSIEVLWDNVEQSVLGLLENSFATHEDNKQNLVSYLKSLNGMQVAIANSNESVEALKKSMENSKGLERSLNQAIRFCVEDLSTYIGNTQRISISIDKIIAKSRFVVGDIIETEVKK